MPLSAAQLLYQNGDLIERAKADRRTHSGADRGAGSASTRCARPPQPATHSVSMVTRKPPAGLEGAPYLVERGISVAGI